MIRVVKPTTSGRRKMSFTDYSLLTKKTPEKKLTKKLDRSFGRDMLGHISIRHRGGGAKRKFRVLSSLEKFIGKDAKVEQIEYDPNRSSFIALVQITDGPKVYLLAWDGVEVGHKVICEEKTEMNKGNRMKLANIPNGIGIYDLEMKALQGGKIVRSAGSTANIVAKDGDLVHVKMPSGEIRKLSKNCFASIGQVSNITHSSQRIGKAGRKRHMGFRPTVRGKAMNPNSHPHGGGEGQNSIGLKYPKTPWGKHALGVRTRKNNKYSDKMIVKRRKK